MVSHLVKMIRMKGFESLPLGRLLAQSVLTDGDLGVAYERSIGFYKDFHNHDRSILVFPRGSTTMECRTRNPGRRFRFDSTRVLYVPSTVEHDDESTSMIFDNFAILPRNGLLEREARAQRIPVSRMGRLSESVLMTRSPWLSELTERFFFEKVIQRRPPGESTRFLEKQIVSECIRLLFQEEYQRGLLAGVLPNKENTPASRALQFIEANLFAPVGLREVAKAAACSIPTLLRSFRQEFRTSPHSYLKSRRLDEAMALLKSGKHTVSETAALVGYEDFSSFSKAFKARFGKSPRQLRPRPQQERSPRSSRR
jgi:AraC-like DNA-binding protein